MSSRWQKRSKAAITVLFNAFFTFIVLHFGSNVCSMPFMVTGAGINLHSLVIKEGKVCWDLYIDGLVISSDGNLLDALSAAIKAALTNTAIPKANISAEVTDDEQPEIDISNEEYLQFDTSSVLVIVTVGADYIVDAIAEEESQMSSAVSISVNRVGHICGLTKRGGSGFDPTSLR